MWTTMLSRGALQLGPVIDRPTSPTEWGRLHGERPSCGASLKHLAVTSKTRAADEVGGYQIKRVGLPCLARASRGRKRCAGSWEDHFVPKQALMRTRFTQCSDLAARERDMHAEICSDRSDNRDLEHMLVFKLKRRPGATRLVTGRRRTGRTSVMPDVSAC